MQRPFRASEPHERNLIAACYGARDIAEQLIEHELDRRPHWQREGAARLAYERLLRDRKGD
jgi:hypothetical protein